MGIIHERIYNYRDVNDVMIRFYKDSLFVVVRFSCGAEVIQFFFFLHCTCKIYFARIRSEHISAFSVSSDRDNESLNVLYTNIL